MEIDHDEMMGRDAHPSLFNFLNVERPIREVGSSIVSLACEPDDYPRAKPRIRYENTYKMSPDAKVSVQQLRDIIHDEMESRLKDVTYVSEECKRLSKTLSQEIKRKVEQLPFRRYKIICLVTIGEKRGQDIRVGSRCIWDINYDTYAESTFENATLFAIGLVFTIYHE